MIKVVLKLLPYLKVALFCTLSWQQIMYCLLRKSSFYRERYICWQGHPSPRFSFINFKNFRIEPDTMLKNVIRRHWLYYILSVGLKICWLNCKFIPVRELGDWFWCCSSPGIKLKQNIIVQVQRLRFKDTSEFQTLTPFGKRLHLPLYVLISVMHFFKILSFY